MVLYRCEACMWFDFRSPITLTVNSSPYGLCRKKWPIVHADKEGNYLSSWVLVKEADFCGEFMPSRENKDGLPK